MVAIMREEDHFMAWLAFGLSKRPRTIGKRDRIPYALETDWPVEAAGFEP
jgi:hypothetical protein